MGRGIDLTVAKNVTLAPSMLRDSPVCLSSCFFLQAYVKSRFKTNVGWTQLPADAAFLGLGNRSDETSAPSLCAARAATLPAAGYRFPAFMPHFQDYEVC